MAKDRRTRKQLQARVSELEILLIGADERGEGWRKNCEQVAGELRAANVEKEKPGAHIADLECHIRAQVVLIEKLTDEKRQLDGGRNLGKEEVSALRKSESRLEAERDGWRDVTESLIAIAVRRFAPEELAHELAKELADIGAVDDNAIWGMITRAYQDAGGRAWNIARNFVGHDDD